MMLQPTVKQQSFSILKRNLIEITGNLSKQKKLKKLNHNKLRCKNFFQKEYTTKNKLLRFLKSIRNNQHSKNLILKFILIFRLVLKGKQTTLNSVLFLNFFLMYQRHAKISEVYALEIMAEKVQDYIIRETNSIESLKDL